MTLLFVFLLACLGFSALTHAFFWYEAKNGPHLAHLDAITGGRAGRLALRNTLFGAATIAATFVLFPVGYLRKYWRALDPVPACPHPPILCVHGLYHNPSAWVLMKRRLGATGFSGVFAWGYRSFGKDFDAIADGLAQEIERVSELFGGRRVIVIGHSLGGLLGRACAAREGTGERIAALVTLGTPHRGSRLAALGVGGLAQGLIFGGPLAARLDALPEAPGLPRLSLYSPADNMVFPPEALRTPGAGWREKETPPMTHVAMLYSAWVAREVAAFLREACEGR